MAGQSDSAAGPDTPQPATRHRVVRPAAGIYGLIVAASVISVVGSEMRTLPLAVAMVVTLVVYWLAEEYAGLIEHASAGHPPTWAHIGAALKAKWPLVSASYVPLVTLLGARLLGATPATSAYIALIVIVVLLMAYGWRASASAGMRGLPKFGMTFLAGFLGVLMILLKSALGGLH